MEAKYLVRFDDICPTSNWANLERIKNVLDAHGVRPILGVVPDNKYEPLDVAPPITDFWERIRNAQANGWTIALHGYQHVMRSNDAGAWWTDPRSEFAGVPAAEQHASLAAAVDIFCENGVTPEAWMAPNHTFDRTTLGLVVDAGIFVITDGQGLWPYRGETGELWIPCQLWSFVPKRFGVWTICCHADSWTEDELDTFEANIARYSGSFTHVDELIQRFGGRRRSWSDSAYTSYRHWRRQRAGSSA